MFEAAYRGIMQGWRNFFEQKWNILDVIVVFSSIALLWLGIETSGGIGEIDTVTAVMIIVMRTLVQFLRLASFIKKKQGQEIQIIDLNDMSEGDEIGNTEKKKFHKNFVVEDKLEEGKKEYQDSQVDGQ